MQLRTLLFNIWFKPVENCNSKNLRRGQLTLHKTYVEVNIFVIKFAGDIGSDNGLKFFEVYNKTCFRIYLAFNRYKQFVVVTMPVRVGTFAKRFQVFFV